MKKKTKQQSMASLTQPFENLASKLQASAKLWFGAEPESGYRAQAQEATHDAQGDDMRQIAFTFSIIALAAKLAQVDGEVSKQSYWAFREVFPMQATEDTKIRSLFLMAMNERSEPDQYIRQIVRLFPARPGLYKEILHRLLKIASADAPLSNNESEYIKRVALKFGFNRQEWKQILGLYAIPKTTDPYEVLGITKKVDAETLKRVHRRLVQENHPDRFAAMGASEETLDMLSSKMAAINAAYDEVRRMIKN